MNKKKNAVRFVVLGSLAGVLELPFAVVLFPISATGWFASWLNNDPILCVGLHLLATLLLRFSISTELYEKSPAAAWRDVYQFLMLFLPVFGWCTCVILFFTAHLWRSEITFTEEDLPLPYTSITPELILPRVQQRERILEELDFTSLPDILMGDDLALKRGAIERLTELKTPDAIDLLLTNRSNPSPEVRFFVTSALTRIKREFDEELESAKEEMKKDIYKISARFLLAKKYFYYSRSRLLGLETSRSYEDESLQNLLFVTESKYASEEAYWLLCDIYQARHEWPQLLNILSLLETSAPAEHLRIAKMRCNAYFHSRQYGELVRHLLEKQPSGLANDPEWNALQQWWGVFT